MGSTPHASAIVHMMKETIMLPAELHAPLVVGANSNYHHDIIVYCIIACP